MSGRELPQQAGNAAKRVQNTSTPPWKRWRERSRHARAIRFIETYLPVIKGVGQGKLLRLAMFQKEWLEEALADGVDVAIQEGPRGIGKSTFGGALGAWAAFDDDDTGDPQVPVIATTISQAVRSCYGVAAKMIARSPELASRSIVYTGIASPRVYVPYNGGELFPVSNDVDGLQGLDPSLGLFDEIGFQPMEAFDALRMATGKRQRSLIVGMGTPGLNRENALWRLQELFEEGAILPGWLFTRYYAPEHLPIDDPETWRLASPALREGFAQERAYRTDLALGQEGSFRIFRLGQWWEGTDSWLGPNARELWGGLADPHRAMADAPTWAGVDVGIKRDSTAVVWAQRRGDGRLHAWARLWVPAPDRPVDVTDVMAFVRELAATYKLEGVAYDARFFDVPAKMLSDERIRMVEVPQSVERMTPIFGSLLELVKAGDLSHDGESSDGSRGLTRHVLNAVARINERGFTLQKGKSHGRIDAAVALGLATHLALHARRPIRRDRSRPRAAGF